MSRSRHRRVTWRLIAGAVSALLVASALQALPAQAAGGPNLAAGKPTSASSVNGAVRHRQPHRRQPGHLLGERHGAFPQWAQVDLGSAISIDQVMLKLPGRLGQPHADPVGAGQHRTAAASPRSSARRAATFTRHSNTVTINFPRDQHPVRAGQHHRQHRLAGRAALRARGVRRSTLVDRQPRLGQGDGRERPLRRLRRRQRQRRQPGAPTGRAPTTRSRSGSRSTSAPSVSVNRVVLKLPTGWGTRTQTLSVQGSTDRLDVHRHRGVGRRTQFNPATGNTVTINFNPTTTRYVRLNITANTGWPAGQISEFEVYGPTGGDTQAADRAGQPRVHPAGQRPDPADLERVDRQRRRHRLRHLRQRRAAHQRRQRR